MQSSSKQRYEPASSSSASDSEDSLQEQPRARRTAKDDEDSVDGLGEVSGDEEKLVGMAEEQESSRVKRLKRSWVMASMPSGSLPSYDAATGADPKAAPKPPTARSFFSGWRLVYFLGTAAVVLALIIIGSILIFKELGEPDETKGAESVGVSTGPYSATGTMPNLALPSTTGVYTRFPELQKLMEGNRHFRQVEEEGHPGHVEELAQGQHPKFAYLGCSDSRVPETEVFDGDIGDLFVTRNVGNQYTIDDLSSETFVSYAVAHLKVQHVVVMGHYSCGAVQAAIASESAEASTDIGEARIDTWIRPIRNLFKTSNHTDIVAFREAHADDETIKGPNRTEPAFRALVEENVKQQVLNLGDDSSIIASWKAFLGHPSSATSSSSDSTESSTPSATSSTAGSSTSNRKRAGSTEQESVELWLHGFVYDVDTGLVTDLGVSRGPAGPLR